MLVDQTRWIQHYSSANVANLGRIMMDTQSDWMASYETAMKMELQYLMSHKDVSLALECPATLSI